MNRLSKLTARLLTCTVFAASVGCTTTRTIDPITDPALFGKVKRFDSVEVQTRDGRRVRFVVDEIEPDAIVSDDGVRYSRAEIAQLRHKSINGWNTLALVLALTIPGAYLGGGPLRALVPLGAAVVAAALGSEDRTPAH